MIEKASIQSNLHNSIGLKEVLERWRLLTPSIHASVWVTEGDEGNIRYCRVIKKG